MTTHLHIALRTGALCLLTAVAAPAAPHHNPAGRGGRARTPRVAITIAAERGR